MRRASRRAQSTERERSSTLGRVQLVNDQLVRLVTGRLSGFCGAWALGWICRRREGGLVSRLAGLQSSRGGSAGVDVKTAAYYSL
ncbi:hypothetical protein BCR35DRAFT_302071 [Leucosporidium creatinivorum]|uniref:Uncharacterized protein n=1 Tax=Leucosporidium creatinivorum TaxID=106004 RepID=A0A1Y2FX73_9BASI|nr:hypothetical protein BCR35DRAFT_302071 [Leucosporidium creatinivorum]